MKIITTFCYAFLFALIFVFTNNLSAQNDLQLATFIPPASTVCDGSTTPVMVQLINNGPSALTTVQMTWSVDGIIQGIAIGGPLGAIPPNNQQMVNLGNVDFKPGKHIIKAWIDAATTVPGPEMIFTNDTVYGTVICQFNGSYIIGPSVAADFLTFKMAIDTLDKYGVCGPTVFNAEPGIYSEHLTITQIPGASANNPVTFQSQNGDSTSVTLTYTPAGTSDNWTLMLDSADYIRFRKMTISSAGNTTYATVIVLKSNASNNVFSNNIIAGVPTTTNSVNRSCIYSAATAPSLDTNNVFQNNLLLDNSYGMYFYGESDVLLESSTQIISNTFRNQYSYGVYMYYQNAPLILSNIIETASANTVFAGIYIHTSDNNITISKNRISFTGGSGDGIYLNNSDGNATKPCVISNNFITQSTGVGAVRGIYPYNCNYIYIYNNSINILNGSSTAGRAIYLNSATTGAYGNIRIVNNIAVNRGGGYAIEISPGAVTLGYVTQCNYNDFFVTGTTLGRYSNSNRPDLASWISYTPFDDNSISVDPHFTSSTDLHTTYYFVNNLGTSLPQVTDDIDGQTRSATVPDMGADEFDILAHDLSVTAWLAPVSGCGLPVAGHVQITVTNLGSGIETAIPVAYSIDGGVTIVGPEFIPGPLAPGASINYTFSASSDFSIPGIYNCAAGVYLASDLNHYNDTLTININSMSAPDISPSITPVSCHGLCNGEVFLNIAGGTPPFLYNWNTGMTINNPVAMCAGTYVVTVTDNNGCTAVETIIMSEPDTLILSTLSTNATCNGTCDGAIASTTTGGTPGYTYEWNDPSSSTSYDLLGQCAGIYCVTLTDANGCSAIACDTITEPAPFIVTASFTIPSGTGLCDGSATVSVTGGTLPYDFLWNDPLTQITQTATGLCAGTYFVTVHDAGSCSATEMVVLNDPSPLDIFLVSSADATCHGSCNGEASVSVTGGVSPYTYLWDDPDAQTTPLPVNLCAGTYTVTITDDNGITGTMPVTINEPDTIIIDLTTTDVTCFSACNGTASASVTGGTPPYTYYWTPYGMTTPDVTGLCIGTQMLLVTDDNGCVANYTTVILQPSSAVSASISSYTNVTCSGGNDGTATVSASGGIPPYSYEWPSGNTSADESGMTSGDGYVTVTDDNGCTATEYFIISEPNPIISWFITDSASCGNADGSATVFVTGGVGPYTYLWDDPGMHIDATADFLTAGVYTVTITDDNACTIESSVAISNSDGPLLTMTSTNVSCAYGNDGTASISAAGGTPPYEYLWDPTGEITPAIADLYAGLYSVTVTDNAGCEGVGIITITEPSELLVTLTSTDDDGSGNGTATASPTGGTPGYTYVWDDPSAQTGATATNLTSGWYSVTVTDANGCTVVEITEVLLGTGIIESATIFGAEIFPNPASTFVNLVVKSAGDGKVEILLFDLTGRQIFNRTENLSGGQLKTILGLTDLPAGNYFLKIQSGSGVIIKQLIKGN